MAGAAAAGGAELGSDVGGRVPDEAGPQAVGGGAVVPGALAVVGDLDASPGEGLGGMGEAAQLYDRGEVRDILTEFGFTAHIRARGEEAQKVKRKARYKARRWVDQRAQFTSPKEPL